MPSKTKTQSFLSGALVLTLSMLVVKLIGALFKIPLTNYILGGTGNGYFSTAYMLFAPIYAVATAGLPVAMAKLVAEYNARNETDRIAKLLGSSKLLFWTVGLVGSTVIILCSGVFVKSIVHNEKAFWSVIAIAPSVLFGCVTSIYRGYYEGLRNFRPTAVSQVVEALVKLITGIGLSYAVIAVANDNFAAGREVFGVMATSAENAGYIAMPYAAAAATLGVTLSMLGGTIYSVLYHKFHGKREQRISIGHGRGSGIKTLLKLAVPISLGALVVNITSIIDLVSIMNALRASINADTDLFMKYWGSKIPAGMPLEDIPNFLYGSFTGLCVSLFALVPAFTASFGKSALPNIAAANSMGDSEALGKSIKSAIFTTGLISLPAGIGVSLLSTEILTFLFGNNPIEIAVAAPVLSVMGVGVIFCAFAVPMFSILQALGRTDLPIKIMIFGTGAKFFANTLLVPSPKIGIVGAGIGTVICYAVIFCMAYVSIKRVSKAKIGLIKTFWNVILGTAAMSLVILLGKAHGFSTLPLIALGGAAYATVVGGVMLVRRKRTGS
jgi:Membrane protein involved in the export of O-antigen and teichoic acid